MIKGKSVIAFPTLGVLSANPFRTGKSTRAKLAKDAKFKGTKHNEITRVAAESAFALHKERDDQGRNQ